MCTDHLLIAVSKFASCKGDDGPLTECCFHSRFVCCKGDDSSVVLSVLVARTCADRSLTQKKNFIDTSRSFGFFVVSALKGC